MKTRLALAAVVAACLATPALADEFYIVQDTTTKECTIVSEKPATETTVVVSPGGAVYATETEAEEALGAIEVCKTVSPDGSVETEVETVD